MKRALIIVGGTIVVVVVVMWFLLGNTSSPTNTPTINPEESIIGDALVTAAQVQVLQAPLRVNVIAEGNLNDACTELYTVKKERDEKSFFITITTARPDKTECAAIARPFRQIIPLDVADLLPGRYQVDVNGVIANFSI